MKRGTRKRQGLVVVILIAVASLASIQNGVGSVAEAEKNQKYAKNVSTEQTGFNGEWIEITNGEVLIRAAEPGNARPTTLPHFYLSRNWKSCLEYTHEAPEGQACSTTFYELLKQADTFLVEG